MYRLEWRHILKDKKIMNWELISMRRGCILKENYNWTISFLNKEKI